MYIYIYIETPGSTISMQRGSRLFGALLSRTSEGEADSMMPVIRKQRVKAFLSLGFVGCTWHLARLSKAFRMLTADSCVTGATGPEVSQTYCKSSIANLALQNQSC